MTPSERLLPRSYHAFLWAPIAAVVGTGVIFHEFLTFAFESNPALNLIIAGVFVTGVLMIALRMRDVSREGAALEACLACVAARTDSPPPAVVRATAAAGIFERLHWFREGAPPVSAAEVEGEMHALVERLERRYEFAQYLVGGMVALGLLGTFVGLLETLVKTSDLIGSIAGADPSSAPMEQQFTKIVTDLKAPLAAMGTAFAASLFGLVGSMTLGLQMVAVRRGAAHLIEVARGRLLALTTAEGELAQPPSGIDAAYLEALAAAMRGQHREALVLLDQATALSVQTLPMLVILREGLTEIRARLSVLEDRSALTAVTLSSTGLLLDDLRGEMSPLFRLPERVETVEARLDGMLSVLQTQQQSVMHVTQAVDGLAKESSARAQRAASDAGEQLRSLQEMARHQATLARGARALESELGQVSAVLAGTRWHAETTHASGIK